MKSGIIFYLFFLLHSLGMSKVCGSLYNPNNFSSVPQMEGDGWVFSDNSWPCSPSYAKSTWEQSSYCTCWEPGKSYCGFVPGLDYQVVGSSELTLSLVLNLSGWKAGRLTIDYGSARSCWKVGLYLNGILVDETSEESKIFQIDFNDADELMVVEWGVLLLHSIEFTCCSELLMSDSSDSYSSEEDIVIRTNNTSASSLLDENIVNRTYNSSASYPLDDDIANRTYTSSGSDSLDMDISDKAYNSSALYSDSIVPITLLVIVTSIVILATGFLCMVLVYKTMTQINWQVSTESLGPVDKFKIQLEGFSDETYVVEKPLQTSVQTGEPSEKRINYV